MAFKIFSFSKIGTTKDLMTCCSGTIEFVGVVGILLLVAGTLQMGSGVYFMLTMPVFSVASNIWTGVVSGLTGTVLTYFGCSDQSRRRPYVLLVFCIVDMVANVANIVITQVGDKALHTFTLEPILESVEVEKEQTMKIGLWVTTGATITSLASAFILANYLFCSQLKGRCLAKKQSPLLKTISEEVLHQQKKSRSSPNRFFSPSRLIQESKVENSRFSSMGFWIPWKDVESSKHIRFADKEFSSDGRLSQDSVYGGGFSLKDLNGGGSVSGNYSRPKTIYRNGIVNMGATLKEHEIDAQGKGLGSSKNLDAKTLKRRKESENYKCDDQQRFSTFKPRRSKVAPSPASQNEIQETEISDPVSQYAVPEIDVDKHLLHINKNFANKIEINDKRDIENANDNSETGIKRVDRAKIYKKVFGENEDVRKEFEGVFSGIYSTPMTLYRNGIVNMGATLEHESDLVGNGFGSQKNLDAKTLGRRRESENYKCDDQQRFSTFKPRSSKVAPSPASQNEISDPVSQYTVPEIDVDKQLLQINKNFANKIEINDKRDVENANDNSETGIERVDSAKIEKVVKKYSDQDKIADKNGIEKIDIMNEDLKLNHPNSKNDADSWMYQLPSVFSNIMEITDFNEFIDNLLTEEPKRESDNIAAVTKNEEILKTFDENYKETEDIKVRQLDTKIGIGAEPEPSSVDLNKFIRSSPNRSKRLKRPKQSPPLPPKLNQPTNSNKEIYQEQH